VARKVKVEVTHPIHDPDGSVVVQPGTQFDPGDKALDDLPAGVVREVIVDEPDVGADLLESAPEPSPPLEPGIIQLRVRAEALGVKVDGRWSAARLQQEIANKERSST